MGTSGGTWRFNWPGKFLSPGAAPGMGEPGGEVGGPCWLMRHRWLLTSERVGTDTVGRYPPSVPQYAPNAHPNAQPPANCGSTSMTAASSRTRSAAMLRPADTPSTRKEHVASTERRRPSSPRRATIFSSASASVPAWIASRSTPAASLAAAQYWIVTSAIWDILLYNGPGRCCPRVLVCLYK